MKKILTFFFASFMFISARAQDSTAVQSAYDCDQLSYYYADAIIQYYSKYNDDSLQMIMEEWGNLCGMTEPLLSFKAIYAMEKGNFNETIYGDNAAGYLLAYQHHAEGSTESGPVPNLPEDYYPYLKSIAKNLKTLDLPPLEKTLANFYATQDETVLEDMDSTLAATSVYRSYTNYKNEQYRLFGRFHLSVFTGVWIPDGKIKVLGTHPVIGMQLGSLWNKLSFDVNLSFRFINSPKEYTVVYQGYLYDTKYYAAFYAGLDAGYTFAEVGKNKLSLLGGIGYDAITVVQSSGEDANDAKYLSSLNLNGGLGYRYYFKKKQYVGLMGKYNFLFYKNRGGTDVSGNALTISLVYGFH